MSDDNHTIHLSWSQATTAFCISGCATLIPFAMISVEDSAFGSMLLMRFGSRMEVCLCVIGGILCHLVAYTGTCIVFHLHNKFSIKIKHRK